MVEKSFEMRQLAEIIPYENNPRINDDAVRDVMESIKQTGNLDPIEVDEDYVILSGHTRLKALINLGYTETEIIKYTGLSDAQKRKYRLLANKTGEKAGWDIEKLDQELADLDFDGYDFGFELPGIDDMMEDDAATGYKGEVQFSEEILLTHNYIVLYFDNDLDWNVAIEKFGLQQVKDLIPRKSQPTGIGRVMDGKKVLEWLN